LEEQRKHSAIGGGIGFNLTKNYGLKPPSPVLFFMAWLIELDGEIMKPWEVKRTVEQYRRMSGAESVEIGAQLSEASIEIFASSLGKRPGPEVQDILWRESEWMSKLSRRRH